MGQTLFRFKKFDLHQNKSVYRISTDSILLGAWTEILGSENRILDIGTGTGVLALMLAQRTRDDSRITAIDIQEASVQLASENIQQSPWAHRMQVLHSQIATYQEQCDLMVTNPPFFNDGPKPPSGMRALSRHTLTLTHDDLFASAERLLTEHGRLCLILPADQGEQLMQNAQRYGLYCTRITTVYSLPNKPASRVLLQCEKKQVNLRPDYLLINDAPNQYSAAFKALTSDFYL